jgi:hypothetical protein
MQTIKEIKKKAVNNYKKWIVKKILNSWIGSSNKIGLLAELRLTTLAKNIEKFKYDVTIKNIDVELRRK